MTKKEWIEMNERTRPIIPSLTDEFVILCEAEPDNVLMRLARIAGLPEGVDPNDERILKIFDISDDSI